MIYIRYAVEFFKALAHPREIINLKDSSHPD